MNEPLAIVTRPLARSWWRETEAPPTIGQFPNHYSSSISWLAGIFLVAAFTSVLLMASTTSKIDRIDAPAQALSLMVGRTMDAQEGLSRAPAWEQRMMRWVSGDGEAERAQAMAWYQELAARSDDPAVHLQQAILQAESSPRLSCQHMSGALAKNRFPPTQTSFERPMAGIALQIVRPSRRCKAAWRMCCLSDGFTIVS
jgi:hypothetical protein